MEAYYVILGTAVFAAGAIGFGVGTVLGGLANRIARRKANAAYMRAYRAKAKTPEAP